MLLVWEIPTSPNAIKFNDVKEGRYFRVPKGKILYQKTNYSQMAVNVETGMEHRFHQDDQIELLDVEITVKGFSL